MEVVAAEPAGDVDDFADEVEAGDFVALHGAGVEFGGVDAAGGDFGFGVAFGAGGSDASRCGVALRLRRGRGWSQSWRVRVECEPALGHAGGEDGAERSVGGG